MRRDDGGRAAVLSRSAKSPDAPHPCEGLGIAKSGSFASVDEEWREEVPAIGSG
jgi:hypothetical protein